MRRLGSLISCSCASTSTALPCPHAVRSYATTTIVPPPKERTRAKALDFTAPLFERKRGTAPWFNPSTTSGSERWMSKSRTAPTIDSSVQRNVVARRTDRSTRLQEMREQNKLALVKSYLALRSSTHSLLRMLPQSTIKQLLDDTELHNLPLVKQMLSQDLRNLKITAKQWQEEKDRTGDLAEYSEREVVNQLGRANEMDAAREGEVVVKQEKGDKILSWMGEDYGNDTWSEVVNSLDQQQARRHLLSIVDAPSIDVLPPVVVDSFPDISDLERLDKIWSQFSYSPPAPLPESTPPALSGEDYRVSLSLLLKIVTPSYLNAQSALPLALRIFRRLVSSRSIPQDAIADTPDEVRVDGEALSSEIIFRLVILRTIVGAATEQKEHTIAMDALKALAGLRSNHLETGELTSDVDFKLLQRQFEDAVYDAQELSRNHYRLRAPLSPSDPLLVAYSFLYEILPSFSHPPLTRPSSTLVVQLLSEFTIEASKRERYDLIGPLWEKMGEFDGHSWIAFPVRTKLLRWFGGSAPFSTYAEGTDEGGLDKRMLDRPTRATNSNAFYDFAVGTFGVLSQRRFVNPIAMADRYVFLRTLCEARITSGRTLDLAIRFYQLFKSTSSIDNPFIFAPATLLSLVRSCTLAGAGVSSPKFANQLISDHISLLTSPTSPYSTPSRRILPQDISTLAQCYSIVGDHESTGQVYRKLLDQKMIPDMKDLLIIFGATARWNPGLARGNLRLAWETGIVITVEMVRVVMLNTIAYLRTEKKGSTNDVRQVLTLGRELGLVNEEIFELEELAASLRVGGMKGYDHAEWNLDDEKLWTMTQRTYHEETRPSVLVSLIRKAGKEDAWRSIITLFRRGVSARIIDERIIDVALTGLLSTYRLDHTPSKRSTLHLAMKEIIDYALSTTPSSLSPLSSNRPTLPIMRGGTFEVILRCCLKVGDLGAVESVRRRMREEGIEVRVDMGRALRSLEVQLGKSMEGEAAKEEGAVVLE